MLLALLVPAVARGEIVWLEKEYDFGLMKEEAGPKTGSVRLVNTGPEEAVITGARPSCGCTGVAYPDDPIAPGDTVKFSFTYNPLGRREDSRNRYVYISAISTWRQSAYAAMCSALPNPSRHSIRWKRDRCAFQKREWRQAK